MSGERRQTIEALARQRIELDAEKENCLREHGAAYEEYRTLVSKALSQAAAGLRRRIEEISGGDPFCSAVMAATEDYLDWMMWALGDLPWFAAAIRPNSDTLSQNTGACGIVYLAGRILDDFLDRHFLYRGERTTLMASLSEKAGPASDPEAMSVIVTFLLCFEGISSAADSRMVQKLVELKRRALAGVMLERTGRENWGPEYYQRLIELKNVDYWRILYTAVDPEFVSPMYPFLTAYYAFAQKLNDVQGYARDEAQSRPNLISIAHNRMDAVEWMLAEDLLQLGAVARALPQPERAIAMFKLCETQTEAYRLGLFKDDSERLDQLDSAGLLWHSHLEEFVRKLGPGVLEDVPCPICGAIECLPLCRAQGFLLKRCAICQHVFVSPRLQSTIQDQLGEELDADFQDPFLGIQKLGAEYLCRLLRKHARGPRLLDLGFGGGYLLRMARAYAFQIYGIDSSSTAVEQLAPMFGRRLKQQRLGDSELPWGAFDVVVMSHVIEHLPDPGRGLKQIKPLMNRGGILYIAAPDIESLQFRIFGNRWNAINPVAHYQFFCEASLSRLLIDCGFEIIGRARHPPLQGKGQTRWMRLLRQLGGDESGELAMLARLPDSETA